MSKSRTGKYKGWRWRAIRTDGKWRGQVMVSTDGLCVIVGRGAKDEAAAKRGAERFVDKQTGAVPDTRGCKWPRGPGNLVKNPAKRNPGTRAPVALSKLHDLSEHGSVLDLQVREGGKVKEYSFAAPRPLLGWSPQADALVWWEGVKMPTARKANPLPAATAKVWERFHGKAPTRMREADVPIPEPWRKLGTAVNIGYRNHGRWGGDANHPFTSTPTVHRAGTRAPYLWVVRGGDLRMTARGIEG